jgi:hypothetical protein
MKIRGYEILARLQVQAIAWTREKCVRIFAHKNTGDLQGENL